MTLSLILWSDADVDVDVVISNKEVSNSESLREAHWKDVTLWAIFYPLFKFEEFRFE